jgi:hypothetical protein
VSSLRMMSLIIRRRLAFEIVPAPSLRVLHLRQLCSDLIYTKCTLFTYVCPHFIMSSLSVIDLNSSSVVFDIFRMALSPTCDAIIFDLNLAFTKAFGGD